ncbi:hypothetical protein, partial [Bacillus sp. mrc49]|uniref:hypothetical protein n=1 Tax=Bacillus sp. mrc49 TaxID=2054913 RepID=UPI001E60689C
PSWSLYPDNLISYKSVFAITFISSTAKISASLCGNNAFANSGRSRKAFFATLWLDIFDQ